MMRSKKKLSTPMTVITIFATLSETSAAVSLPFLDNEEREMYIWFLICFPFYLLFLFFATLNFNYRSLYAPSDYEKGEHFINALDAAQTIQGTPSQIRVWKNLCVRHRIELPERLDDLHIVDARNLNRKLDVRELLSRTRPVTDAGSAQVVVFLINNESENVLKEIAGKYFRQARKHNGSPICMAYNLSSHELTLIDQPGQSDAQRSVTFQDQRQ